MNRWELILVHMSRKVEVTIIMLLWENQVFHVLVQSYSMQAICIFSRSQTAMITMDARQEFCLPELILPHVKLQAVLIQIKKVLGWNLRTERCF